MGPISIRARLRTYEKRPAHGNGVQSLLPANENPMYTEGYEGFYHLDRMTGCVEEADGLHHQDHDRAKFERRKELFSQAAGFLNQKYGSGTVEAA